MLIVDGDAESVEYPKVQMAIDKNTSRSVSPPEWRSDRPNEEARSLFNQYRLSFRNFTCALFGCITKSADEAYESGLSLICAFDTALRAIEVFPDGLHNGYLCVRDDEIDFLVIFARLVSPLQLRIHE